jgi:ribonuclease HI
MIEIYTDGAYSSSRNQGGWAFVVVQNNEIIYKEYDGLLNTTNNRMEIMGMLRALEYIKSNELQLPIKIYTDSMYVIGTLTLNWKMKKNIDLWEKLLPLVNKDIQYLHVKGHDGNKFNEECDKWAVFGSNLLNCKNDKEWLFKN